MYHNHRVIVSNKTKLQKYGQKKLTFSSIEGGEFSITFELARHFGVLSNRPKSLQRAFQRHYKNHKQTIDEFIFEK